METPILCIGRQYGSGGREIGEKLAASLQIPYYDKLLLEKAARDACVSEQLLQANDERPARFGGVLSGNPFADTASVAHAFYSGSQVAYDAGRTAILDIAGQGPCVIIGRCASAILRGRENVRSIFIYADPEDRLRRCMARNGLGEKEAQRRIRKIDRMRKEYFDFYADTAWGEPESYDLMLSSSRYGIDGCAELIRASLQH